MSSRAEIARDVIAEVHRTLPEDASLKQRKDALKAAYPFSRREYWPYKAWCKERRKYLARYEKPKPIPDGQFGPDIIFPFREKADA